MKKTMRNLNIIIIIACAYILNGCIGATSSPNANVESSPNNVESSPNNNLLSDTITTQLYYSSSNSPTELHANVNLGHSQLIVAVDSGSVGLRVLASKLKSLQDITLSNQDVTFSYASGTVLNGKVASGQFTIEGITTNLQFMLVESVTCDVGHPNCDTSFGNGFSDGVMGIRLDNYSDPAHNLLQGVWNPLAQLPGNYGKGFIVNASRNNMYLTLGLTKNNTQGFSYLKLKSIQDSSAIYNLWDIGLRGNYKVNDFTSNDMNFLFDTGNPSTFFYKDTFPHEYTINDQIRDGLQVDFILKDDQGHQLKLSESMGHTEWYDSGVTLKQDFDLGINTGINPFTKYAIAYDIESGQIGFKLN